MWPFKPKAIIPHGMAKWHQEKFDWLIEEFAEETDFHSRKLALPDAKTFRSSGKSGHALACHIFEQVKAIAGVPYLVADLTPTNEAMPEYQGQNIARPVLPNVAAGTFSLMGGNRVHITYESKLLAEPMNLIATLAHELAHYVLATSRSKWPIEDEDEEFLTDLTAVFLGFGVFLSNTAFEFSQFSEGTIQGWSFKRMGYLPQNDLIYATALFLRRRGMDAEAACRYLKPGLDKLLRRALATI